MTLASVGIRVYNCAIRPPPLTDIPARLRAALEGSYGLDRELGAGGMATVYLARDRKHDRRFTPRP